MMLIIGCTGGKCTECTPVYRACSVHWCTRFGCTLSVLYLFGLPLLVPRRGVCTGHHLDWYAGDRVVSRTRVALGRERKSHAVRRPLLW